VLYARENAAAVKDILFLRLIERKNGKFLRTTASPMAGSCKYYGLFIIVLLFDCGKSG
jgi:hypothetical protein